jgi:hypothetical protein
MKKYLFLLCTLFSFTQQIYADINWDSPETLSTSMVDASEPQIVMDSDGNTTAVWVESTLIKASYLPLGGSWETVETLSSSGSSSPRIAVDGSGDVTAVWVDSGVVKTAKRPAGGSWSSETSLSSSGASSPAIALRPNGDAVVVWERAGFIEAKTKLLAGLWSLVSMLSGSNTDHPDVSVGADGTVIAIWHAVSSGADIVQSASQVLGGVWGTPKNLLPVSSAYSHNYPKVAVDANGNASAIWFRYQLTSDGDFINLGVFASVLPKNAAAWLPVATVLSGPGIRNPADLFAKISYDNAGNALALWTISYDNSSFSVESSLKLVGGEWSPKVQLVDNNLYSFSADIDANTLGNVVGVYTFYDGSSLVIQSAETSISGVNSDVSWTSPIDISTMGNNAFPKVASTFTDSTVYAASAWLGYDGANTTLQVAVGSTSTVAPPSNLAVTQDVTDFGVYADYHNTITWDASSAPDIVEYVIYRNGVLFLRVAPDVFEAVEHNVVPEAPVTYGVAAVDSQLSQSEIVYINYP